MLCFCKYLLCALINIKVVQCTDFLLPTHSQTYVVYFLNFKKGVQKIPPVTYK